LLPPAGCDLNAALLQLTKPRLTASTWSVNGGALMSSLFGLLVYLVYALLRAEEF
jgi:K+-transporting ATPase KdpF subunit